MIPLLYKPFQHWAEKGSVFILSDLHLDDPDCKLMDPNWISPEEQIAMINSMVFKQAVRNIAKENFDIIINTEVEGVVDERVEAWLTNSDLIKEAKSKIDNRINTIIDEKIAEQIGDKIKEAASFIDAIPNRIKEQVSKECLQTFGIEQPISKPVSDFSQEMNTEEETTPVKKMSRDQKIKLCRIFNNSGDVDALVYMRPFCNKAQRDLVEHLLSLYMATDIGWGDDQCSMEDIDAYNEGKYSLLTSFGLEVRMDNTYFEDELFM